MPDDVANRAAGSDPAPAAALTERMRADLKTAIRERDQVQVRTLRSTMAAIANAEAPPITTDARGSADEPDVGRLVEHRRLDLSPDDVARVLRHEIADRDDTIEQYLANGRTEEAEVLRAEQAVIQRYR